MQNTGILVVAVFSSKIPVENTDAKYRLRGGINYTLCRIPQMTKRARRRRPNKIIMMRSRHDEDEDEDDGYDNPSPWKRPRLMRPLKALLLVSALYFATARNDEVQFQDDKGAGELFIGRLLSSTHEMRIVHALRVNVHVCGILKESLGEMLAPVRKYPHCSPSRSC